MQSNVPERVTAEIDGDFVVFRTGVRINAFRRVYAWLPTLPATSRMLRELEADPESGLFGYRTHLGVRNQTMTRYWRSFEQLRTYARDPEGEHLPALRRFTRELGSSGDVGIWHETYLVRECEYEAVYNNMSRSVSARRANWCLPRATARPGRDDLAAPRTTVRRSTRTRRRGSRERASRRRSGIRVHPIGRRDQPRVSGPAAGYDSPSDAVGSGRVGL
jgi:hypothetical protein